MFNSMSPVGAGKILALRVDAAHESVDAAVGETLVDVLAHALHLVVAGAALAAVRAERVDAGGAVEAGGQPEAALVHVVAAVGPLVVAEPLLAGRHTAEAAHGVAALVAHRARVTGTLVNILHRSIAQVLPFVSTTN